MNPYDEPYAVGDALGQMLRWSLRREAARSVPPPGAWAQIQRRTQAWEQGRVGRRRARRIVHRLAVLARKILAEAGCLSAWCAQVWTFVDEHTFSSETVWAAEADSRPRTMRALRHRLTVETVSAWPLLGQKVPII